MKPRFRPSLAQTKRQNQQALDFYRIISVREDAPHIDVGAKAKRERAPADPTDNEADVLRAVGQLLARHPAVAVAIRMNSGMAYNANGQPISFHKLLHGRGVVTDYIGWFKDGTPYAIECKRPSWRRSTGSNDAATREQAQAWFIEGCIQSGGVGGFVRSVDEALVLLPGATS